MLRHLPVTPLHDPFLLRKLALAYITTKRKKIEGDKLKMSGNWQTDRKLNCVLSEEN